MNRREFRQKNSRRIALVAKKYGGGVTDEEGTELATLQAEVGAEVERHFPRDGSVLDDILARLDVLKLAKRKAKP